MIQSDKFCLTFGGFQDNIRGIFKELQNEKEFCDVTLVCEDNQQFEAHKVILSASSSLLRDLLKSTKHSHPLLYMWGVKTRDLANVVNFIYNGQVEIYQSDLNHFLLVARQLQLVGINELDHGEELNETKPSLETGTGPLHELNQLDIEDTKVEHIEEKNIEFVNIEEGNIEEGNIEEGNIEENIEDDKPKRIHHKKRTSPIWNYFSQNTNDALSINCKIVNCERKLSRGKTKAKLGNKCMFNHLSRIHPIQFEEYVANKVEMNKCINELKISEEFNETKPVYAVMEADTDTELNKEELEDKYQESIEDEKPKRGGKKRISTIWNYFSQSKNDKKSVHCNIGNCERKLSRGKENPSNGTMIKHLRKKHKTQFEEYGDSKVEFKKRINTFDSTFVHKNLDLEINVEMRESQELEQFDEKKSNKTSKKSYIWHYFDEDQDDRSLAVCQVR